MTRGFAPYSLRSPTIYIKCQIISIINWVFEIEFMKRITHA